MKKNIFFEKINTYRQFALLIFLYLTLIVGFYFNEDSLGAARTDYASMKIISLFFSENFLYALFNYDDLNVGGPVTRHSPIFLIWESLFWKLNFKDVFFRLINLHFCLLIIFIFYKCLKYKFTNVNNIILTFIASAVFLSPTFRSSSIWPDSYLFGLFFFLISIYLFLKFEKETKKERKLFLALLNTFILAVSAYISPNFSLFSIFYFFYYFKYFKFSRELIFIIILNLILSFPAFYYLFVLDINFLAPGDKFQFEENVFTLLNLSNKIILLPTLIFFHFIPFLPYILKNINFNLIFKSKKEIFLISLFFLISAYIFDFKYTYESTKGGGLFYQLSQFFFSNNFLVFFISYFSAILIYVLSYKNLRNILIILLLFFSNPQITIYHNYFEPLLYILIFLILDIKFSNHFFLEKKNISYIFIFSILFLTLNLIKNDIQLLLS